MTTGFSTIGTLSANQGPSLTGSGSNSAQDQLITNYETFLQLLTTQIQNQDPTEPLNAQDFTDQLVQYSAIEQQILTNESLESLINITQSTNADSLVAYIGNQVEANGNTTLLENGQAQWTLSSDRAAEDAQVFIYNEFGAVVHSDTLDLQNGNNSYVWDGRSSAGNQLNDGAYSIAIVAQDGDGAPISVSTSVTGTVSEVDFSTGEPSLVVGNTRIPLSAVQSVSVPST